MIFGVLCAIGVMMFPEAREAVLVELDSQSRELSEIARNRSLDSIKSSFLDASIYKDIVAETETEPVVEQLVWADQKVEAESPALLEPTAVSSTPNPDSKAQEVEDVISPHSDSFKPVFHAVWSPFRSERSATGFAATLSSRLNREFRVVRLAAGRYEVGFDYSSDQELLNVLDSVLDFTSSGASKTKVSL